MLERLWTSILELMAQVVTPDWGVLVSLIPVGILILLRVCPATARDLEAEAEANTETPDEPATSQ